MNEDDNVTAMNTYALMGAVILLAFVYLLAQRGFVWWMLLHLGTGGAMLWPWLQNKFSEVTVP